MTRFWITGQKRGNSLRSSSMRLRQTLGFLAGGGGGKVSVGGDEELVQTSMFGVFPSTLPDTAGTFIESGRDEAASYERGNFRGRPSRRQGQFADVAQSVVFVRISESPS